MGQQSNQIKKLREENQQLKQQLAESERKLEEYKKCNCKECMTDYEKNLNQIIDKYLNENIKLKKQLAEKDRQIEQLKKFDELNKTFFDLFRAAFKEPNKVDDLFNTLKTMQEKQDQDKISFALDVLKIAQDYIQQYVNDFDDKNDCLCAIDKLIKQLTHQHEDKGE